MNKTMNGQKNELALKKCSLNHPMQVLDSVERDIQPKTEEKIKWK